MFEGLGLGGFLERNTVVGAATANAQRGYEPHSDTCGGTSTYQGWYCPHRQMCEGMHHRKLGAGTSKETQIRSRLDDQGLPSELQKIGSDEEGGL